MWFDKLTTNGGHTQPFALSLSKGDGVWFDKLTTNGHLARPPSLVG